ncbi:unnamed protein product [Meganyctiphanes norvegica]|uniref:Mre11 DNA-binding domain-containing protein n=1 Tax=Meganyctiphanes norvegica TaxID=48144 RepID=A0AAV2RQU8_MEGNR
MGSTQDESLSTFKILVATDNHLGVWEKNPERGNDSFETFEEVLAIAVEQDVDFILLEGDLFHENKPSRQCVLRCMELLKKCTHGDKSVQFDFLSDAAENFKHIKNPVVNYMDPNLNIGVPIFSIHGNHDDPSGLGQHCALELLSSSGLINYFGKTSDLKDINIMPLLLEKGETKFAIFGLSSIKDERLFRLFKEGKVKMLRPKEYEDKWFNLMVLHQNHNKQCGMINHIPESFLDNFLDLVVWDHEHECILQAQVPHESAPDSFHVIQPGSSVATSLCAGKAVPKQVALLEVFKRKFSITPVDLKTVRPFVFAMVSLSDHDLDDATSIMENSPVENFVEEKVRDMIKESETQITGHSKQPKKPLIRLRVEFSNEAQMFNVVRFGHKFAEVVANPEDMILFKKEKKEVKKDELGIDNDAMDAAFNDMEVEETRVEDLVRQYFAGIENQVQNLSLLSERGLCGER